MPYHYQESTRLSNENALAIKSLAATGELPKDHYWNTLRARHDANPTRFDRGNYVLGALLDRDQAQRQGTLSASSPLLPNGGFFSYAGAKHTLNATRFDHWHPFLGRLFEIKLPSAPAGQGLTDTPPPTNPIITTPGGGTGTIGTGTGTGTGDSGNPLGNPSQLLPPSSGTNSGPGNGGTGPVFSEPPPSSVPEPASAVMLGMAMALVLAGMALTRLVRRTRPDLARPATA